MIIQMGMAGVATGDYWFQYSPSDVLAIIQKYNVTLPLPDDAAASAIGKWIYYFQNGSFENNPDGRMGAAAAIARDIANEGGGTYSQAQVFSVLQNANSYLLKEQKLPATDRGPQSEIAKVVNTVKSAASELEARTSDAASAVKNAFDPSKLWAAQGLFQKVGIATLVGVTAVVLWKIFKR